MPTKLAQIRVDAELEAKAAAVLAGLGLTVPEAVERMLTEVVCRQKLPFEMCTPNAETRAAMREADEFFRARRAEREQA